MQSLIRDPNLSPAGEKKIAWVAAHMPVLAAIRQEMEKTRPFAGVRVALCIHLEAKTANLALTLKAAGAEVVATGSNPLSTRDDIAAALVASGVRVFAWYNPTPEEYREHLRLTLETRPHLVIDDGGDLVHLLHTELRGVAEGVIGGCEETTTGILRLKALEREGKLLFPMVAVNNAQMKYLFDNRYGTGESVWAAIMRTTNLVVAGKTVVVCGYGWCGKGVSLRARGLGARVIVCEVDPIKAVEAVMDGFEVMPSLEAAAKGDIFITTTGCRDVLRAEHFRQMKDGALLANAGHFNVEISLKDLAQLSVRQEEVRENITAYYLEDGRRLYLLGQGRLVNLAAGDGHPAEIMDLSFSLQALAARYVLERGKELPPRVHPVPPEIDRQVAELRLAAWGIEIDRLTPEQEAYLASWEGE
ncbi:adenosylhomocysteinase [Ammonifex thiophilus]|uniref:Adenosylhomocysteinase n=1 Tax=Ammonifex thiophilus TaxID=444093 RepID=A0A3D8P3Y1_9THEO|nr:adenosylhomocysteinase [Ammonifex thiophilus]RDV83605.1 adenosylhomocysteinase [Ammonifex thiophilus]